MDPVYVSNAYNNLFLTATENFISHQIGKEVLFPF
jgi:hypothetical protein